VTLVDSNILIYAAQPAHAHLRRFIADHAPAVSAVSYVEVLGYHQLNDQEQQYLEEFFRLARVFAPIGSCPRPSGGTTPAAEDIPRRCSGGRHGAGAWADVGDPQRG
jgi:hypothetical protein